jgi:hypothetical protein
MRRAAIAALIAVAAAAAAIGAIDPVRSDIARYHQEVLDPVCAIEGVIVESVEELLRRRADLGPDELRELDDANLVRYREASAIIERFEARTPEVRRVRDRLGALYDAVLLVLGATLEAVQASDATAWRRAQERMSRLDFEAAESERERLCSAHRCPRAGCGAED